MEKYSLQNKGHWLMQQELQLCKDICHKGVIVTCIWDTLAIKAIVARYIDFYIKVVSKGRDIQESSMTWV